MKYQSTPEMLVAIRDKYGFDSNEDVGTFLGVSHVAVSNWSTGKATPTPSNGRRMAEALGVSAKDVLSLQDAERQLRRGELAARQYRFSKTKRAQQLRLDEIRREKIAVKRRLERLATLQRKAMMAAASKPANSKSS